MSTDSLQKATRVLLTATSPTKDALRNLGIFTFIVLYLFYVGGRHSNAVMDLLRLNERLEDLHTDVQGMISYPYPSTTFLFDVSRLWSLCLNSCVAALA